MFWHAPALVHWHGVSPLKSLFFSLVACVPQPGRVPGLRLGVAGDFFGVGVVMALLATLASDPELASVLMLPTAMLMAAMFFLDLFQFLGSFETRRRTSPPTTAGPH